MCEYLTVCVWMNAAGSDTNAGRLAGYLNDGYEIVSAVAGGLGICYVLRRPKRNRVA